MPVMDGAACCAVWPLTRRYVTFPVVIMSSLPEATVAERRAGYTAFMRKPFKITDVVSLTERLIGAP